MKRGPKRLERCRRGLHLMTPGNRRVKSYIDADGVTRGVSNGCRRCNAERTAERNFAIKLSYASDGVSR